MQKVCWLQEPIHWSSKILIKIYSRLSPRNLIYLFHVIFLYFFQLEGERCNIITERGRQRWENENTAHNHVSKRMQRIPSCFLKFPKCHVENNIFIFLTCFMNLLKREEKAECFRGVIVDNEKRLHASALDGSWQIFHIDECLMMKQKTFFCLNRFTELWINFCQNEIMIVRAKAEMKQRNSFEGFDSSPRSLFNCFLFPIFSCLLFACIIKHQQRTPSRFWLLFSICWGETCQRLVSYSHAIFFIKCMIFFPRLAIFVLRLS